MVSGRVVYCKSICHSLCLLIGLAGIDSSYICYFFIWWVSDLHGIILKSHPLFFLFGRHFKKSYLSTTQIQTQVLLLASLACSHCATVIFLTE